MLTSDDQAYLLRRLGQNDCVLFLGAGFSRDATNRISQPMPLSKDLCDALWGFLGYPGEWDGTPLPDMYQALLTSGKTYGEISHFLEDRLLTSEVPVTYDHIARPFWYRIYTTNVDDLLKRVYRRVADSPSLQVLGFPRDEIAERDQTLERMQAVFLHGHLPCRPDDITFSVRQFARRASDQSPLYQAFVSDYSTRPTVFIGTELNEPLFWQHLEVREQRLRGISEQRPKSFLIAPKISPPKAAQLAQLNVVPVLASTGDFLEWLGSADLPSRKSVLRQTIPAVVRLFEAVEHREPIHGALAEFGNAFHLVPTSVSRTGDRSFYLLGATPRWEDILQDLDTPRSLTDVLWDRIEEIIESNEPVRVLAVTGSAGCGKSTILRRLGVRLARAGRLVFLSNSEELPDEDVISRSLNALPGRSVLLFDNAEIALNALAPVVEELRHSPRPPVIVVAARSNELYRRGVRLHNITDIEEHRVRHLSRPEVVGIISVLEENGLLGRLQGMTDEERVHEFEARERAGKQLLVAMREATKGGGFDTIIKDEFDTLKGHGVKLLYLIIALTTDAGYRLDRAQVLKASPLPPAETLHALERSLRDIVIPTGPRRDQLLLRHRIIADHVLRVAASRTIVAEAYKELLPVLAGEMTGRGYRSSVSGMFRALLNHREVFERFESNVAEARAIFESVEIRLRREAHFWLQYGLLELEYGNLEYAENYLMQAESLSPNSRYIVNSLGHLYLKKAVHADSQTEAWEYRRRGSDILQRQMEEYDSPYPYHIYCSQRLSWTRTWDLEPGRLREELEHLRQIAREGRERFPRNRMLRRLYDDVEREYLGLALG
ncbi:MAG: SIR2 family protein [Gemmatimonadetes bacterium]|nr:SIR2 family protein [Gemmatimonadota bacterium]